MIRQNTGLSLLLAAMIGTAANVLPVPEQALPGGQQAQQQGLPAHQEPLGLKLATDLVSLSVAVTDRSGRAITGFKREDFKVFESGVEQPVSFFSRVSGR